MVIKVVIPAMISVLTDVPFSLRWKTRSKSPVSFCMGMLLSRETLILRFNQRFLKSIMEIRTYYMIFGNQWQ